MADQVSVDEKRLEMLEAVFKKLIEVRDRIQPARNDFAMPTAWLNEILEEIKRG